MFQVINNRNNRLTIEKLSIPHLRVVFFLWLGMTALSVIAIIAEFLLSSIVNHTTD